MTIKQSKGTKANPQQFALWVGMAAIIMMFGAFTSAYIVKHAAGGWLEFPMPSIFYFSTVVLVASSITLHLSYLAYKRQNEMPYKMLLVVSLILGLVFIVLQYSGWSELFNMGVDIKANVSGSFFYLITGVHALHILAGVAAIIVALIHAFTLKFRYGEKRKSRFQLVVHYWHFVDVLWVYLFIFLLTN